VLNIRKLVKNYRETGALSEQCSVFSFINDWCFITKKGAMGTVIAVEGIDYECLDQRALDSTTKRLEAAFKLCGPEFRVYQYLVKSHFQPDPPPAYNNPVVRRAELERSRYFAQKAEEMFSIHIYYVLLYQSASHAARITFTKALGSFFSQGFKAGAANLKSLFSAKKEILLIEEEIEQATTILLRHANSLVSYLSDLVEIRLLNKQDAFQMLLRIFNVDPEKQQQRLKFDVMTDKYLVNSPLESHPDHLTIDGYHTRILTLREEPSESRPLVLQQLLRIPATYHIVTEWRAVEASEAVHYIESMRTHFHKTKSSLSVSSGGDRLRDETKVEFVDDLNECLKEVQKRGNYFGKFSLTVVIYDRDRVKVEKAVSDFGKAFSNVGSALYSETYNQLSAFFATCPGNSHFNYRQLYITNNNYADWSFLFTLHEGHRWNTFLNREALAIVETADGTPFYLNLHQRIQDGSGNTSDDVAHTFLTGRTGSGKSFFANFLTLALQKYDPRTFIFDLGGSYEKLTHILGGSYLKIGAENPGYKINPFSLEPTSANIEFLFSLVQVLIAGHDGYQTTTEDDRNIFQAIETLYVLDRDIRRLKTLAGTLPRHLADRLHKWIEGGQYGHLFDNIEDTITLATLQCFDFQGMDEYPQLIQALLFYVLHRAGAVIYDPAIRAALKIFILDEAWKFFTVPVIRNYLVKAAKTWRKHNGVLIMATQSPEDLKESNLLPLLDSFPTKIFLANADADYGFYTEKFHLNPREVELIQTLIPKREGLIKTSTMGKKFVLNVDRKSYWLYTNSPKDNERFNAVVQEHGFEHGLELLGTTPRS
jgi:type IV secretion/conjugal transfer VirB4 family ATPase